MSTPLRAALVSGTVLTSLSGAMLVGAVTQVRAQASVSLGEISVTSPSPIQGRPLRHHRQRPRRPVCYRWQPTRSRR
jgi:hypothetical protein